MGPEARPLERIAGRWVAGASAIWRGDSALLRTQLVELGRDTLSSARTATRSLRALALGRGGNHAAAAESLLVIERQHGQQRTPVLGIAFAADRIFGAEWLIESQRYAPADSLLRYTRGFPVTGETTMASQATFGAAQLLRSRIAEAMGKKQDAIDFAKIFLASFDMAPPQAKPRLDEARERIKRLGGTLDAPRGLAVPAPAKR
jgi:hypothetical protein